MYDKGMANTTTKRTNHRDSETAVLRKCVQALGELSVDAQIRVAKYLLDRSQYHVQAKPEAPPERGV